ncbi:hypothetical protein SAMN04490240_4104 [Rhodococcus pyridinivorans]|nr:hypothetical protein SAMN04490240_4104 [Rhodococcus pyridinivorans]
MTTIDFTWSTPEWTESDSDALDAAIIAERERSVVGRCVGCLRPFPSSKFGVHGTVEHGGRSRCRTCYKRAQRRGEF